MLISDDRARAHLRVESDDEIAVYVGAAEISAQEFMNRNVYPDDGALAAAVAAAPAAMSLATASYEAALALANTIENCVEREIALFSAHENYKSATVIARQTYLGMVVNEAIEAAILLTLGHLYANRESVVVGQNAVEIPMGAKWLLQPFRKSMGA